MNMTQTVVAANSAKSFNDIVAVLDFISVYPSEEGKKAVKALKGVIISTLCIIFFVMMPLIIGTVLYFEREPVMPVGAAYRVGAVHSKIHEDQFSVYIDGEILKYKTSDYTDEKFEKGQGLHVYFNDKDEIVLITSDSDPVGVFLLLSMVPLPLALLLLNALVGGRTYFKWWRLYVNWYRYEIAPLRYQENFWELVKDKKYYNVLIKKSALDDADLKLYKKYNGLAIAGGIGIVVALIIAVAAITVIQLKYGLGVNINFVWVIMGIVVVALCFFIMHFDKKAREIKEAYLKKKITAET